MSHATTVDRLVDRFIAAADQYPELSAIVWKDAPSAGDTPFIPPIPDVQIAPGRCLDALHVFICGNTAGTGWSWLVAVPATESGIACGERAMVQLDMLTREVHATLALPDRNDRPGLRIPYLLVEIAERTPSSERIACLPDDESRWLPLDPRIWTRPAAIARGLTMPGWWCIRLPHLFQRIGNYLRSVQQASTLTAADGAGSPLESAASKTGKVKGKNVEGQMRVLCSQDPERRHWTAAQFAEHISCSESSVTDNDFWKQELASVKSQEAASRATRGQKTDGRRTPRKRR